MRKLAVIAVAVLAVAACGGDDAEGFDTPDQIADELACSGFKADSEELFVEEGGACRLDGEQVSIYTFESGDAQESYLEIASEFGGLYLVGDGWAVSGSRATLSNVRDSLGGEIN